MKKLLSIFIVAALLLSFAVGCNSNNSTSGTDGASNSQSGVISTADVNYVDSNGEMQYTLVRAAKTGVSYTVCANMLKEISDKLGLRAKVIDSNSTDSADGFEILVGETTRPETKTAKEYLLSKTGGRNNDYIICTIGKKIVIYGMCDEALQAAANRFYETYLASVTIKGGIEDVYKTEGDFENITINNHDLSGYSIIRPHYNSGYLAQVEMESLRDVLLSKTGYCLGIKDDTKTESGAREIIVGNTTRDGVEALTDYDTYSIKISGDKVYLNGGSPYATAMAVSEFSKMLQKGAITEANSTTGSYKAAMASYDAAKTYRLVWADDFDGQWVDETKWDIINSSGEGQNGKTYWRSESSISFSNGMIHYTLTQDAENYYGATLKTNDKFKYQYGYIETSARLPHGQGYWTALWTDGTINHKYGNPEVDIIESFGNGAITNANAHTWAKNKAKEDFGWTKRSFDNLQNGRRSYYLEEESGERLSDGFHTFGFMWTPEALIFTGDGEIYCKLDMTDALYADYKYIYNLMPQKLTLTSIFGVEGSPAKIQGDDSENWNKTNVFSADYVHVYQLNDGQSLLYADAPVQW
ncbi:MAG: family 16 glycosylhydrolase [Clostridia bacterium]|nr:family 16 glycosylhydrolase [Clostridia bacterium]MBO5912712.1 family 16 glycosylhydrolase [Clostridia bacterium]